MTDYEKIYNFENLYRAYRKARQGKRWKGAAAKFEVNLLEALNLLSYQLKTNIYPLRNGVDFLGFHAYLTETGAVIRKVRRRSKNNMKRKLKKMRGLVERGKIITATVEQSYKSWRGHAAKGNCYHLIRRTDHYYNRLFNSKEAEKCQKH